MVDPEVHAEVFSQVDPQAGEQIGRALPGVYAKEYERKLEALLASEP